MPSTDRMKMLIEQVKPSDCLASGAVTSRAEFGAENISNVCLVAARALSR
jgi:hypothetical protein